MEPNLAQLFARTQSKSEIPDPFEHQRATTDFVLSHPRVLVLNDPGTGKTRSVLDAISRLRSEGGGKALVFAPKAILVPAWVKDAERFTPHLKLSVANANNREKAFKAECDIVVTNHDAVRWIEDHKALLKGFSVLVLDESTAYKNPSSQRSRAMKTISKLFDRRACMTGTPMPNGVLDIWHQALITDDGERLGKSFYAFRNAVCEPKQTGPRPEMCEWVDKEGATDVVADLLRDITVRFKFEDCIDVPEHTVNTIEFDLDPKLEQVYLRMKAQAILELENGDKVTGVNAAAVLSKLLQIASGAVYGSDGIYHVLDSTRYDLIAELVEQREASVVSFLWRHQRDQIKEVFDKRGIKYAVIDGETPAGLVPSIVDQFQRGELRALLAHPQSASHGLTLTKGTTTIWASPTFDAERFEQFNRRIYRAGQTQRTQTILIQASNTVEKSVYERLQGKLTKQLDLLGLIQTLTKEAA
jgi:SNF2 family DNA or RNA helicase